MTKPILGSIFILTFGLLTAVACMAAIDQPANASSGTQERNAAIFTFASQSEPITNTAALSSQACVDYNRDAKSDAKTPATDAAR